MIMMNLSETERTILNIIAEKSHRSTSTGVFNTAVTQESGLPPDEVYNIVNQLASLALIKMDLGGRKPAGADFLGGRIINITKEGLDATSQNQARR
jgi:hypothetical protein